MSKKDQQAMVQLAKKLGCVVSYSGSGHIRIVTPGGESVYTSGTNPGGRALQNLKSRLRRAGVPVPHD